MSSSPFEACDVCGTPVVSPREHKRRAHGIAPDVRQQSCAYCGVTFERDHSDQQYCSPACGQRARQQGGGT